MGLEAGGSRRVTGSGADDAATRWRASALGSALGTGSSSAMARVGSERQPDRMSGADSARAARRGHARRGRGARGCPLRGRGHWGHGVSAPVIGRQRRSGRRAAVASSRRRTGVARGAARSSSGRSRASAAMAMQRVGERVERLERFGLGRLDEQALLDDEREVDGRRVEAVVDQALGDVERADPVLAAQVAGAEPRTRACRARRRAGRRRRPRVPAGSSRRARHPR